MSKRNKIVGFTNKIECSDFSYGLMRVSQSKCLNDDVIIVIFRKADYDALIEEMAKMIDCHNCSLSTKCNVDEILLKDCYKKIIKYLRNITAKPKEKKR